MAEQAKTAEELQKIEVLAKKMELKQWILVGVMTANNWAAGKQMTALEFKAAVEGWLKRPMSGAAQENKGKKG